MDDRGEIKNANSLTNADTNDISWLAEEDQSWRSYIDNTPAMKENATTKKNDNNARDLGSLYDFYKVIYNTYMYIYIYIYTGALRHKVLVPTSRRYHSNAHKGFHIFISIIKALHGSFPS